MRLAGIAFIGTPTDARGFRLAGAAAYICADRPRAEVIVRGWSTPGAEAPALVLVSAPVYALAPDLFDALDGPIVLVLPDRVAIGSKPDATHVGPRSDIVATSLRPVSEASSSV